MKWRPFSAFFGGKAGMPFLIEPCVVPKTQRMPAISVTGLDFPQLQTENCRNWGCRRFRLHFVLVFDGRTSIIIAQNVSPGWKKGKWACGQCSFDFCLVCLAGWPGLCPSRSSSPVPSLSHVCVCVCVCVKNKQIYSTHSPAYMCINSLSRGQRRRQQHQMNE